MKSTVLDILIPTYNREKYIVETLEGLRRQTNHDFNVLIYDDGSTDDTLETIIHWCDEYNYGDKLKTEGPLPFELLINFGRENMGVSYARNKLMEMSQARYCMWQDSDDIPHEKRVEFMLKEMVGSTNGIIFSQLYFFQDGGVYTRTRTKKVIDLSKYINREGLNNNMTFATAIFNSKLKKYKFNTTKRKQEDIEWLAKLIRENIQIGYLEKPLYYVRRHNGRLTYNNNV